MVYKFPIPGKPELVTLVSKVRLNRWLARNSSVRLVYATDEDVTRSLASPQMGCVVQVRVLPSGACRVKHRRFRQSLMKEYPQSSISGCNSVWLRVLIDN